MDSSKHLSYSEIENAIQDAPLTWLPALLVTCVLACRNQEVFTGPVSKFVENFERKLDGTDDL